MQRLERLDCRIEVSVVRQPLQVGIKFSRSIPHSESYFTYSVVLVFGLLRRRAIVRPFVTAFALIIVTGVICATRSAANGNNTCVRFFEEESGTTPELIQGSARCVPKLH